LWIKPHITAAFEAVAITYFHALLYTIADPETVAATDFDKELYPLHDLVFNENAAMAFRNRSLSTPTNCGQFPAHGPADTDFFWTTLSLPLDAAALTRSANDSTTTDCGNRSIFHSCSLRALELNGQGS
jgi:hypothetical protein